MQVTGSRNVARTGSSSWTHERWGGFLLTQQRGQLVHVRLTGCLSSRTLVEIDRRLRDRLRPGTTHLLALDATDLQHIPMSVVEDLAQHERRWRSLGIVAVWVGLHSYLADLLVLVCGPDQHLPAVADLDALEPLLDDIGDRATSVVRGWLEIRSVLLH